MTAHKASGKHIPDAPTGEPGSTLNPSDPAAPNYAFALQGVDTSAVLDGIDQGSGVQTPTPVFSAADHGEGEDGVTWIDETVALGRRIAVTTGEDGDSQITREEILPGNATEAQVVAAKDRLRKRLVAA